MKMLFHVDGIRCSSCVSKIEKIPLIDSRIQTAKVYLLQNLLEVEFSDTTTTQKSPKAQDVILLLKGIGFSSHYLKDRVLDFEKNKQLNRKRISEIAIAGFAAGNIMLFSAALYTGADATFRHLFSYLSAVLFLPLILYSAREIHKSAWGALKLKTLNIDLPISVAMISGFLLSTYNLFQGHFDYIYFDSIASFVFLILFSRYVLERLKQHYVSFESLMNKSLASHYNKVTPHGVESTRFEDLNIDDVITLNVGDILPTEAESLSADVCEIDTSHVTGEALPQKLHPGVMAPSGSRVLTQGAQFKVVKRYEDSTLAQLDARLDEAQKAKGRYISLADKAAHYLIAIVFTVAALFFAYYSQINGFEAFQRALALLIVACPCALALGTPLAYILGVRNALTNGILVKSNEVFDKLLEIKTLFFDKTGTLTTGQLRLKATSLEAPVEIKNLILNLESHSQHPMALALRQAWAQEYKSLKMGPVRELPGKGVESIFEGKKVELKKVQDESMGLSSELVIDGRRVLRLEFEDTLLDSSPRALKDLQEQFDKVFLISGDSYSESLRVAKLCHLTPEQVIHSATPFVKAKLLKDTKLALMIGDGANDALALQSAHVGIAASGSVDLSLNNADVYFLKPGIESLQKLFKIAETVRGRIRSNLTISFIYNLLAGVAALVGEVTPLVAAILMPISSLVIIFNSRRGLT